MTRLIVLVAALAFAADAYAQTEADLRYRDSVLGVRPTVPRPGFSAYADLSAMSGSMGRGKTGHMSMGLGMRIQTLVVEVHGGTTIGAATAEETLLLAGISLPLTRSLSFEAMCGTSMMNGYSEGRLLYTEHVSDLEVLLGELITLGLADIERTRKYYEHHELGTGVAMRLSLTGITWDWMRLGLIVAGRTEFKEHTTQIAIGLSMQAGVF